MSPREFETLMNFMAAAINREISDETKEAWYQMLCDLPYQIAKAAFMRVLAQNEYQTLPPVGLIRRAALDLSAGPTLTAAEAWGIVLRAVHAFGFYQERKALESMPENVAQVVKWMGWQEICHSDNLDVVRGQFIRMYDTQTSRKRDLELMPPEVRQMISAAVLQLPEKTGKELR